MTQVPVAWVAEELTRQRFDKSWTVGLWTDVMAGRSGRARSLIAQWCDRHDLGPGATEYVWQRRLADSRSELAVSRPFPAQLGYDGMYVLLDGHNRAARMVVEGAKTLPIEVSEIHPLWTHLEDTLSGIYKSRSLYQPIEHPRFSDWKVLRPGRVEVVRDYLRRALVEGRLLLQQNAGDFGCLTGGMTRMMAELGFFALGYDWDTTVLRVSGYLDLVFGTRATYRKQDLYALTDNNCPRFGPCILLSVLHHRVGHDSLQVRKLLELAGKRSRVVIADLPSPEDEPLLNGFPLSCVEPLYRDTLPEHKVEMMGEHQGRRMLAFWAKEFR